MKVYGVLVLAAGLLAGAGEDARTKELKKFQGEWVAVSVVVNGKEVPREAAVVVAGTKLTFNEGGRTSEATFTFDPTQKPKHIRMNHGKLAGKPVRSIGIYEFDGDKLKVCLGPAEGKRPKEFSTKGGTLEKPLILIVYGRPKKDK
jgi:uncharacterized protein (TIGR03067 family)